MKSTTRWFIAVVVAQAGFLLCWAGWHERVRSTSPFVKLETRPVDPQDLLRGDYMILRYQISEIRPAAGAKTPAVPGTDYWVVLERRGDFHRAVSATTSKPDLAPGQIVVKGTWGGGRGGDMAYGIENFYVPEGKGTPRFKTIEVEASVSPDHRLYLKRVLVDGKSYP